MKSFRIRPLASRAAVLASGGLDSSVLLAEYARRGRHVFPIYVRAGLKWERDELAVLRRFLTALRRDRRLHVESLTALELPVDDGERNHWTVTGRGVPGFRAALASNYILGRNLSLLVKAAVFCAHRRIRDLAMAPLESNPFPDARPEFFRAVERAIALGTGLPLRILTPYAGLTKAQVIRRGRAAPLGLTLSCARPRGTLHCGSCTKCAERIEGFAAAGVVDPARYLRRSRRISRAIAR